MFLQKEPGLGLSGGIPGSTITLGDESRCPWKPSARSRYEDTDSEVDEMAMNRPKPEYVFLYLYFISFFGNTRDWIQDFMLARH